MKVLILAGGLGTRISEESELKPKPMVEIGGKPILWHIMKTYSYYGFNDFVILCGYKGYVIKEYFANYYQHSADMTIDLHNNAIEYHKSYAEPWRVTLVDTGLDTMTGGRIKRAEKYIDNKAFMLTYGDGVSDINFRNLLKYHKGHGKLMTLSAVKPEGRFGALKINATGRVERFEEKPKGDGAWINGGFFICQPEVIKFIKDDFTVWEREPLQQIARDCELMAHNHEGFWKPMDTLRDKNQLEVLIKTGEAPWMVWNN